MKNRIILAIATVLILAVGLTAGNHVLEDSAVITLYANQNKLVSLPYNCSFTSAQLLRNDIMAAAGYPPPYPFGIVNVYNWNGTAWQRYAGGGAGQVNFVITPGNGYMALSTVEVTAWNVTGTHNPATYITLTANTRKVVSIPYESPSTTASLLRNEIIAAGGTGVSIYNRDGMAWQRWSGGGIGQLDFEIVPGTGYLVKSTSDVTAWYPASN